MYIYDYDYSDKEYGTDYDWHDEYQHYCGYMDYDEYWDCNNTGEWGGLDDSDILQYSS